MIPFYKYALSPVDEGVAIKRVLGAIYKKLLPTPHSQQLEIISDFANRLEKAFPLTGKNWFLPSLLRKGLRNIEKEPNKLYALEAALEDYPRVINPIAAKEALGPWWGDAARVLNKVKDKPEIEARLADTIRKLKKRNLGNTIRALSNPK